MTGPIYKARMEARLQQRREMRENQTPWYVYGPIPHRPAGTACVSEILPTDETIEHYKALPALYGKRVAAELAAMSVHGVPITERLLDYLEAQAVRDVIRQEQARQESVGARKEGKRRRSEDSWVYFIQHDGRIKIGVSVNPVARATSLSLRWTDIVAVIKGDRKLERALHKRFAKHRIGDTEWFTDCSAIRTYMEQFAEPFSAQHPSYIKPKDNGPRPYVRPEIAYQNLANAIGGTLDK